MARSDAGKQRRDCGNAVERRRKGMVEPQRIRRGKVGECNADRNNGLMGKGVPAKLGLTKGK